jgi:N-acetyl-1-D-myo-inositol-2-amino-2-deoxy-alpha-D-glucopyranoside deacetylase
MMGTPQNDDPRCLWQADLAQCVRALVAIVRELRPQVLVTYDSNGGYGHPDHIRAHQITVGAFTAAADPDYAPELGAPWQAAKLYHTAIPKSVLQAGIDMMRESGQGTGFMADVTSADELPIGVPDEVVTTEVDARDFLEHKTAALRAYRTQISVDGPFFALADGVGNRAFGIEHYILASGELGPRDTASGRESDLFAGIA